MKSKRNSNIVLRAALRVAVLALSTGTLAASAIHAQDAPPPMRGPGGGGPEQQQRQLDHMTRELALTPDQVTQIKAIQTDSRTQMQTMRSDATIAGPDRHTKMVAIRDAEQGKIKAALTDAQKVKYDAMMEKMKENRERRQNDSAPPTPPPSTN